MSETTKRIDFENWLMEYHCENNPEILDDMLPDCFADWVADLDCEDWIRLGNIYAKKIATYLHQEVLKGKIEELNYIKNWIYENNYNEMINSAHLFNRIADLQRQIKEQS